MKQDSSIISWNKLGTEWLKLAQTGESRIYFLMPYMLEKLGDVHGKEILDLGSGEGGYSRMLTIGGADVTDIDCSESSIKYSTEQSLLEGLTIKHFVRNCNDLYGINDSSFDIVLCSMMLMDCEDLDGTIKEISRVLKPSGKVFVSVLHPCFNGHYEDGIGRQGQGLDRQVVIKNYFQPSQWEAPLPKGNAAVIWRHRTLEEYIKGFIKYGLTIVDLNEPCPTMEQAKKSDAIAWLQKIPLYLFFELKK